MAGNGTANLTFLGQGPATLVASKAANLVSTASTALAQETCMGERRGSGAQILSGYATWTGDSTSSTAVLNYVDGTVALNFTPKMIMASRVGGTATSTIDVVSVTDNADGGLTATVQLSGNLNAATIIVGVTLYPA